MCKIFPVFGHPWVVDSLFRNYQCCVSAISSMLIRIKTRFISELIVNFLAPVSGSALPIRIRIQDSQINVGPESGFGSTCNFTLKSLWFFSEKPSRYQDWKIGHSVLRLPSSGESGTELAIWKWLFHTNKQRKRVGECICYRLFFHWFSPVLFCLFVYCKNAGIDDDGKYDRQK